MAKADAFYSVVIDSVDTAVSSFNKQILEAENAKKVAASSLKTLGYTLEDKLYAAIKGLKEFKDLMIYIEHTRDKQMPADLYLRLNVPLKNTPTYAQSVR